MVSTVRVELGDVLMIRAPAVYPAEMAFSLAAWARGDRGRVIGWATSHRTRSRPKPKHIGSLRGTPVDGGEGPSRRAGPRVDGALGNRKVRV